jgi:hypothetical protein
MQFGNESIESEGSQFGNEGIPNEFGNGEREAFMPIHFRQSMLNKDWSPLLKV